MAKVYVEAWNGMLWLTFGTYGALQIGEKVEGEFASYGKYLGAEWSNNAAWIQTCNIYVACNGQLWNSAQDDMDTLHAAQMIRW